MKLIAKNKKALFEYEVLERMEAGISLLGWEVKSIKSGNVSLKESFVTLRGSEAWVLNMHVSIWKTNDGSQYQETRERKLLLSKKELALLYKHTRMKGSAGHPLGSRAG
jgi:SsrA-binding protein